MEGPSLLRAVLDNDPEQVKRAIEIGAPPTSRFKHGNTALHLGMSYFLYHSNHHIENLALNINNNVVAVSHNNPEIVKVSQLIQHKISDKFSRFDLLT